MSELFKLQPRVDVPGPLAIFIVVVVWFGRKLGRLAHITLRSPAPWILTALAVATWQAVHALPWLVFVLAPWALCVAAFWRMNFPEGFQRHVVGRALGTARSLLVYRWRWSFALKTCGVIARWRDAPLLVRTFSTPMYDQLRVRMVAGQRAADFADRTDRLTQTFNALDCRVQPVPNRPHWLDLTFFTADPLIKTVPPYPPEPDWMDGLPVAIREDGKPWLLKLIGSHLLIVGATGAGKSGVLWAIIDQLIPGIMDRLVRLWVLDPKGGMELAAGQKHFDRFVFGSQPGEFAGVLEDAVRVMHRRQARLRGVTRLHEPSADEPLIVVIVDEMAALTAWTTDGVARDRVETSLNLLLSQGRAVGVVVIGAVQDPHKETLPNRDLFPTRIALRLVEASQVAMALGQGAWDNGAKCDEIADDQPGVGFVVIEGEAGHRRVRFAHVTDDMIKDFKAPALVDAA